MEKIELIFISTNNSPDKFTSYCQDDKLKELTPQTPILGYDENDQRLEFVDTLVDVKKYHLFIIHDKIDSTRMDGLFGDDYQNYSYLLYHKDTNPDIVNKFPKTHRYKSMHVDCYEYDIIGEIINSHSEVYNRVLKKMKTYLP